MSRIHGHAGARGTAQGSVARRLAFGGMAAAALLLQACTTPPRPAPPPAPAPVAPPAAVAPDPLPAAIATLQARAEVAQREARWLDAVTLRQALTLLQPADRGTIDALAQTVAARDAAVADALDRARRALREGDADAAQRHHLQVLVWSPGHPAAVQALRALERERAERQPRRFSRDPALRLPAVR